eukprot:scaffold95806_cov77-Phaeocystis_antarctica.AAC.2
MGTSQAPPEEMSLPLNVHLTGDLSGTNPMCVLFRIDHTTARLSARPPELSLSLKAVVRRERKVHCHRTETTILSPAKQKHNPVSQMYGN